MKLFMLSLCALMLVLQVNGAMVDFDKLIKSMRSSASDPKFKYLGAFKDPKEYDVPQAAIDEFRTYVDNLQSDEPFVSDDMSKELERELDLVRKAVLEYDQGEQNPAVKLKPGQVPGLDCGQFGCCADGTKADSSGNDGCAFKLCEDVYKTTCGGFSEREKESKCRRSVYLKKCPYTCNSCKAAAAPIKACELLYPASMCCWDGTPARGPNGLGCKPCKDVYPSVCKIFRRIRNGCSSNSWRIRTFMSRSCARTCGMCN